MQWRLDPTDQSGSSLVVEDFCSEENPYVISVTAVSSSEVDVRYNQAMLQGGGVFDPTNFTLSGSGQGTAGSQPDTISLISTGSGPVYRLGWSGDMNGGLASLTAANATDPRGNPLWVGSGAVFQTINGIVPGQSPEITSVEVSGGNITLSGTNGTAGAEYCVVSTTNAAICSASRSCNMK